MLWLLLWLPLFACLFLRFFVLICSQFVRRDPVFVAAEDAKAKELFVIPEHYRESIESVLIPHGFVVDRASKLAADIREDYGSSVPHLLCVLKVCTLLRPAAAHGFRRMLLTFQGGHEFFTDLTAALRTQHQQSGSSALPYTFDFVRLQSYEGTSSTGSVTISGIKLEEIAGLDVLIVEDIVDTGAVACCCASEAAGSCAFWCRPVHVPAHPAPDDVLPQVCARCYAP